MADITFARNDHMVKIAARTDLGRDFIMLFAHVKVDAGVGCWIERNISSIRDIKEEAIKRGVSYIEI